jgi:uncharacterized membrane-anchored protein
MRNVRAGLLVGLFGVVFSSIALAGAEPAAAPPEPKFKPTVGPAKVDAGNDVLIDLPSDYLFLDAPQAKQYMEKMGNLWNDDLLGVVTQDEATWLVTIRYTGEGYVKDDEAEKLDADEILKAIREGTEEANKERAERGFRALHVAGWSEPPRYARDRHQLVWGIRGKADDEPEEVVNFNTRVLGRRGYVSLNLIDGASQIEGSKPAVAKLLSATTFKMGSRYEDFDAKTDKVAEYGLAALVAGGAGAAALKFAKMGLLAKFGTKLIALLIAGKKVVALAVIGILALLGKLFGRKKETAAAAPPPNPPAGSEPPPPSSDAGPGAPGVG